MVLTRGSDYGLFVTAPGYLYKSQHFNLTNEDPEQLVIDLRLLPVHAGSSMVLQNIFFDYDSYALKQESLPELEKATRFLRENPSIRIEISGHTDNTGTETKNQSLSVNRAKSVADQLIRSGIDGSRIKASGYGSSRPVVPNDTEAGRQRNRRIEFKVLNVQ